MKAVRLKNTRPELLLQGELRKQGLSFATHTSPIKGSPRRADIVFRKARVCVLVHGCFWHSCPEHATKPKSNVEWWEEKLERNRRRDRATIVELQASGWSVIRVWEHEEMADAAVRIRVMLETSAGGALGILPF
jgi:DNA mismatch endonuclease (patch repair protein)